MGMVPLVVQSGASATVMHVRPQINTAPNISTIPGRISRKLDSGFRHIAGGSLPIWRFHQEKK